MLIVLLLTVAPSFLLLSSVKVAVLGLESVVVTPTVASVFIGDCFSAVSEGEVDDDALKTLVFLLLMSFPGYQPTRVTLCYLRKPQEGGQKIKQ
jgi:hypothetical protein